MSSIPFFFSRRAKNWIALALKSASVNSFMNQYEVLFMNHMAKLKYDTVKVVDPFSNDWDCTTVISALFCCSFIPGSL